MLRRYQASDDPAGPPGQAGSGGGPDGVLSPPARRTPRRAVIGRVSRAAWSPPSPSTGARPWAITVSLPGEIEWIMGQYAGQRADRLAVAEGPEESATRCDLFVDAVKERFDPSAGSGQGPGAVAAVLTPGFRRFFGAELCTALIRAGVTTHLFIAGGGFRAYELLRHVRPGSARRAVRGSGRGAAARDGAPVRDLRLAAGARHRAPSWTCCTWTAWASWASRTTAGATRSTATSTSSSRHRAAGW